LIFTDLLKTEPLLKKYNDECELLSPMVLHGFLTGVASCPSFIKPSEWIAIIMDEVTWDSEEEAKSFSAMCTELFQDCQRRLDDYLLKDFFPDGVGFDNRNWSNGYLIGIEFWDANFDGHKSLERLISAFTYFQSTGAHRELIEKELKKDSSFDMSQLPSPIDMALEVYSTLKKEYVEGSKSVSLENNSNILPVKNENQKVGRNDPCICGSGKKFKKCCG